jgi:very-short-patch-repair endonuclease
MIRTRISCDKCNKEISLSNFDRHYGSCKGPRVKKIRGIDYDPNARFKDHSYDRPSAWNKGLNKDTSEIVAQIGKTYSDKVKSGDIVIIPKTPSAETKQKISESMKLAHSEGRAWNIGKSRWNNLPSYPEQFFMLVIQNEFLDRNYVREYPFGKYSIDFAWPHLKKAIEIDGEQHQRFSEIAERDRLKDKLLIQNSWEVLRIPWKTFCKKTKQTIRECKDFIHSQ